MAELEGFRRRGHAVWLLAPVASEIHRRARLAGLPGCGLEVARWRYPVETLSWARWLRRERVEILNTHSSRDGWLLGLAGRLARVPLLVRTRHIDVDYPNRWISRHAFTTFADHVLTTSRKITAHLQQRFGLPDDRVSTVPTGIDVERFSPEAPVATLRPDWQGQGLPLIGMVSVLRSWKGHQTFLDAARHLRVGGAPLGFVIVGEGPIRAQIEGWIRERQLEHCVHLTGHREDVPSVLRALSVLVIASTRHEGVPQVGLQALAAMTPVVGSDVGGTPEIIREGDTGRIFPAGDAAGLAARIREALTEVETTRGQVARGRRLAVEQHSLEAMLDQLETVYRRRVQRRGRRTT